MNLEQILDEEEIIESHFFNGDYGKIKLAVHLFVINFLSNIFLLGVLPHTKQNQRDG